MLVVLALGTTLPAAPASAAPFEPFEPPPVRGRAGFFSDACGLEVSFVDHVKGRSKVIAEDPLTELTLQTSEVVFSAVETDGRAVLHQRGVTRVRVTEIHGQPDAEGVVEATIEGRTAFRNRWTGASGRTVLVEAAVRTFTQRVLIDVDDAEILELPDDPTFDPMFTVLAVKGNPASPAERAAAVCPELR